MSRLPLIWRVFLSTSLVTTLLFGGIGYLVQTHFARTSELMLEEELRSSFRAYETLWKSRSELLASISRVMSGMPNVRAAFSTGDRATIEDTAGELWARVSQADAAFLVTDPDGDIIASLSNRLPSAVRRIEAVTAAAPSFPRQSSGYSFLGDQLWHVVVTPVFVDSSREPALINVLVAGYPVDDNLAETVRGLTNGSDAVITVRGKVVASTLPRDKASALAQVSIRPGELDQADSGSEKWSILGTALNDVNGQSIGDLRILRPLTPALQRFTDPRLEIAGMWA
ncbi:MAG: hypothetical protein H7039_22220, partial [Bryobacteraceae bacterium]|nr:hypothetical protein [Bryobacteraceae bacterium]